MLKFFHTVSVGNIQIFAHKFSKIVIEMFIFTNELKLDSNKTVDKWGTE